MLELLALLSHHNVEFLCFYLSYRRIKVFRRPALTTYIPWKLVSRQTVPLRRPKSQLYLYWWNSIYRILAHVEKYWLFFKWCIVHEKHFIFLVPGDVCGSIFFFLRVEAELRVLGVKHTRRVQLSRHHSIASTSQKICFGPNRLGSTSQFKGAWVNSKTILVPIYVTLGKVRLAILGWHEILAVKLGPNLP
jgi:hypothetical protein